jgi:hypothetical protein
MGVGAASTILRGVAVHEAWTINRPGETARGRNATWGGDTFDMGVVTVDEHMAGWARAMGPSRVAMMKIDTDGYDFRVLRGAETTILRDRPRILIEFGYCASDLGDDIGDAMRFIMYRLNYNIYEQDGHEQFSLGWRDWYPHQTTRDYALLPAEQELRPLD